MSNIDVARAWKDAAYLESLTEAERALVPANPAGEIALSDEDLALIAGGTGGEELSDQQVNTGTTSRNPPCACSC